MHPILYNISQVLGITVLHSLWQGLLVYCVLRLVLAAGGSLSAVKRYSLSVMALAALSVWFIYTLVTEAVAYKWGYLSAANAGVLPHINLNMPARQITHSIAGYYRVLSGYLPYISVIYLTGLVVNMLRLGWEWNKIREIKRSLIPAGQMQQFVNSFAKKMNISRYIHLNFSELVTVPCMIGYLKPLIILPVSLATYLSADEVEAILLHELSHIKRNDYLVNMLQQVITVMLFFNPFSQLINRLVNQERENSCDDLVIEKTGKPLIYAQALLKLEDKRAVTLQLALAATGKKFYLLNRIERIMKTKKQNGSIRHLFIAMLALAGGVCSIAWFNPKAEAKSSAKAIKHAALKPGVTVAPEKTSEPLTLIAATDSNKYSDTIKHSKNKNKIVVINNGKRREYNSLDEMPDSDRMKFAGMDSIGKKFNTEAWKKQSEAWAKQAQAMSKKFNSAEWKKQSEVWTKQAEEMRKKFDSPEWKNQMLAMQKQGEEMSKKFTSTEWRQQSEAWAKQAGEMTKKFNSEEWKKQAEGWAKQAEEMNKKFNSEAWKKQSEGWAKQAEEMNKKFDSPEWKAQMENMSKMGEEMNKKFDSPEWKAQMENMSKMGEEMSKKFNSPEWKNMKQGDWILSDSTGGVKVYHQKHPAKKVKKPTN